MVFNRASTATGSTAPAKTLIGFPSGIRNVVVDTVNDRLYAVGVTGVYIVNSVSTASGAVTATAILPPSGGSLTAIAVNTAAVRRQRWVRLGEHAIVRSSARKISGR
jgi:hypothetical protein